MSVLLRGIKSNHVGDFSYLNCFHSYGTENKLEKHGKVCNDPDSCVICCFLIQLYSKTQTAHPVIPFFFFKKSKI